VTPRLLLRHGWALDRTLWDGVLKALGQDAVLFDAGYYGRPLQPPETHGPLLGVGHSLGALELLAEPPPGLLGVVAIDGFARFGQADDFPQGVPARVLARMSKRVADGALVEFLHRAGGAPPAGTPDAARLQQGLERLQTLDGRRCPLPVWRLQSQDDPIATLAMSDASFAGMTVMERRVRPASDHLSPIHDPAACADLIHAALKAFA
jgi:pimeloyl-[acyl-carrier protein] methyl ester esterase